MILTKIISSLEKPFADAGFDDYTALSRLSALRGEAISFQLLYTFVKGEGNRFWDVFKIELSGDLAKYATVREVKAVAVTKPCGVKIDDNYLRSTPGAYPDLLFPITDDNRFAASNEILNSHWIDIFIPDDTALNGEHEIKVKISHSGEVVSENSITVDIIGASLPKQRIAHTMWYSNPSIVSYYGLEEWSDRNFQICENYLSVARKNGVNTVLIPLFSLLGITKVGNEFRFFDEKLERFTAIAEKLDFDFYEMPHMFTAGTAEWARGFKYTEDGEEKTTHGLRATDPRYTEILRATLKHAIDFFKAHGHSEKLYFHIADEPSIEKIEYFRAARESIIDLICDYPTIDAIFDIEFWKQGLVSSPVPITDEIEPFIDAGVDNLWTYYCTGPQTKCSNRFIAQRGACTRSLGMQLYKFKLKGFLHWALCYYMGGDAGGLINPYVEQSAKNWVPAGDSFAVYPTQDGCAYESMRLLLLRDAFQDIRAMELCEELYSHDEVVATIEEVLGCELKFSVCAKENDTMLRIRERINSMIKAKI